MIWLLEHPEELREERLLPYLPLLDAERRERIRGYRFERNRIESILAGLLLRYAFAAETGKALPQIERDDKGKPFFPDRPELGFSLSHCSTAVCCALGSGPVGADVQTTVNYDRKYRRILSEPERAWVEAADSDRRFTALWTRKEAFGKALGCGIGYDMKQTRLAGSFSEPREIDGWLLRTAERGNWFLSVCARTALSLRIVEVEALLKEYETGGTANV